MNLSRCARRCLSTTGWAARRPPTVKKLRDLGMPGEEVTVSGWVRSVRYQKDVAFMELNDGSCLKSLQVVMDSNLAKSAELATGASAVVEGSLVQSPAAAQRVELSAKSVTLVGSCDQKAYALQKKGHSLEFLREIMHLRPRTNTISSVLRLRNALTMAVHNYFQGQGFANIHTPILTSNDCEGAGELFTVSGGPAHMLGGLFGRPAFLTVSGQLHAEAFASALSRVYTFGPTFRAEVLNSVQTPLRPSSLVFPLLQNSNTTRHLCEFWMVEPEMAFADLEDVMATAEGCVKAAASAALETCGEDMAFFAERVDSGCMARVEGALNRPFARLEYREAISILAAAPVEFSQPVAYADGLSSEQERFLAEVHCKGPVFVMNYPSTIKPFYMRRNPDNKTVGCIDLLVPRVGELIGGSEREWRLPLLLEAMAARGLYDPSVDKGLNWYIDLRRYGASPLAGWGLGFERLVQFVSGIENIRDAIPIPRVPGSCRM